MGGSLRIDGNTSMHRLQQLADGDGLRLTGTRQDGKILLHAGKGDANAASVLDGANAKGAHEAQTLGKMALLKVLTNEYGEDVADKTIGAMKDDVFSDSTFLDRDMIRKAVEIADSKVGELSDDEIRQANDMSEEEFDTAMREEFGDLVDELDAIDPDKPELTDDEVDREIAELEKQVGNQDPPGGPHDEALAESEAAFDHALGELEDALAPVAELSDVLSGQGGVEDDAPSVGSGPSDRAGRPDAPPPPSGRNKPKPPAGPPPARPQHRARAFWPDGPPPMQGKEPAKRPRSAPPPPPSSKPQPMTPPGQPAPPPPGQAVVPGGQKAGQSSRTGTSARPSEATQPTRVPTWWAKLTGRTEKADSLSSRRADYGVRKRLAARKEYSATVKVADKYLEKAKGLQGTGGRRERRAIRTSNKAQANLYLANMSRGGARGWKKAILSVLDRFRSGGARADMSKVSLDGPSAAMKRAVRERFTDHPGLIPDDPAQRARIAEDAIRSHIAL